MNFPRHNIYTFMEILSLCLSLASGCVLGWAMFGEKNPFFVGIAGIIFTIFLIITIALMIDPDKIRARQSLSVLSLASNLLEGMQEGLNIESAQRACEILYRSSSASAVAITDTEVVLGYCGSGKEDLGALGCPIRTTATKLTIEDGKTRVLNSPEEVGLPKKVRAIKAAIIVPLFIGKNIIGSLKFYYPNASRITETQVSIAEGFAQLISTQAAAMELEEQKKLATSMELKALQSQINPHFLFNTINTLAAFIRTDPEKARVLLREFAVFYRSMLENASDLIPLSREVEQTVRYLSLEQARFGEERLDVQVSIGDDIRALMVPAFMIQPLVENSIKHGFPAEGQLVISIQGEMDVTDVYLYVADNGTGMTQDALDNIMSPDSQTGLGIAVKNINDRILGYYGEESYMRYESELGKGTRVTLYLKDCAKNQPEIPETSPSPDDLFK